jgi:dTDP-glucose 4,6-dehydratase
MKILVTGGAGFIGSNFVHYILNNYPDDQVVNLDLLTYAGNPANCACWNDDPRYTFVHGDICDVELVDQLVADVDVIVHFAAESHVDRSIEDAGAFVRTNVVGTYTLLDAALRHGKKRFHHISTDEVFGDLMMDEPAFTETTPYDPSSPYSAAKAASDHFVRAYHRTHGLPVTISNCTNNYGFYHFPEKLIPLAITNILEGKKVPVYGTGQQVRDWLFVTDHCRAIDMIVRKGTIGETYCIGGDNQPTNLELVQNIIRMMEHNPDEMIEFVEDRKGHDFRYDIDYTKIKTELGWEPQVTLDEGLEQTIAWYKEHPEWWQPLKKALEK